MEIDIYNQAVELRGEIDRINGDLTRVNKKFGYAADKESDVGYVGFYHPDDDDSASVDLSYYPQLGKKIKSLIIDELNRMKAELEQQFKNLRS